MTILSNPPSYFEQWIQEQDVDGLETLPPYIRRPKAGPSRPGLHKPSPLDFTGHSQEDSNVQLSLTLTGDANLSRQHPCFVQGRPISGTVSLSQHKDAQIRSIYLLVRGRFNPHHQPHRGVDFLCVRLNLWSTADAPLSDSDEWPFSIVLPKEVNLVELATGKSEAISLPSSFNEDRVPASIEYDLIVRLDRGAFKRAYWLQTSFEFLRDDRPGPSSLLSQLARQYNSPVIGPSIDPDGWEHLPPVTLELSVFESQVSSFDCFVSLARPVSALINATQLPPKS